MPKFQISDARSRQAAIDYIAKLPENGKRLDVSITLHRERRSIPQNSLYWMWVGLISDETGNNANDLHEAFKAMFLGSKTVEIAGITHEIPLSTTSLDTAGFTHFLERLEAWATSELGIVLPHPEDAFWSEFEQRYGVK